MNICNLMRLAEGGAAGVVNLHQRALQQGWRHICLRLRQRRQKASAIRTIRRSSNAPRMAIANIALFRLFNRDLFGNFNELYRTIAHSGRWSCISCAAQLLAKSKSVVRFAKSENHKPDVTLVWTLHDHWVLRTLRLYRRFEGWKQAARNARP